MSGESPRKKPKLVQQESAKIKKTCPKHEGSNIEMFCNTDQSWVCFFCFRDEHKDHDAVAAVVKRTEKQNELEQEQKKCLQTIQKKQKERKELQDNLNGIEFKAQAAIEKTEKIFNQLILSAKKKVTDLIRDEEKAEVSRAKQDLKKLELEIADVKSTFKELQQLSQTTDHIHFLQTFPDLCVLSESEDLPSINPHLSFDKANKMILYLKEKVKTFCEVDLNQIPLEDSKNCIEKIKREEGTPDMQNVAKILQVEPLKPNKAEAPSLRTSRIIFLQHFRHLLLDPNTAHRNLHLSKIEREVMWTRNKQIYAVHPDRFDSCEQVLCKEALRGCCYWEVEWLAGSSIAISVSYKGIGRKGDGDECRFGANSQSWSLVCNESAYYFWHRNVKTEIDRPYGSRIGVYVDHTRGLLFFYSISDAKLIHTVKTTFTEPLYAGFGVYSGAKIRLCY